MRVAATYNIGAKFSNTDLNNSCPVNYSTPDDRDPTDPAQAYHRF
jgi:hypothetical protein